MLDIFNGLSKSADCFYTHAVTMHAYARSWHAQTDVNAIIVCSFWSSKLTELDTTRVEYQQDPPEIYWTYFQQVQIYKHIRMSQRRKSSLQLRNRQHLKANVDPEWSAAAVHRTGPQSYKFRRAATGHVQQTVPCPIRPPLRRVCFLARCE